MKINYFEKYKLSPLFITFLVRNQISNQNDAKSTTAVLNAEICFSERENVPGSAPAMFKIVGNQSTAWKSLFKVQCID